MSGGVSGGGSAPAFTRFRCPKCGTVIAVPIPCVEVTHPCPKNITKKPETLKGEQ